MKLFQVAIFLTLCGRLRAEEEVPHLSKDTSEHHAITYQWSFTEPNYISDGVEFLGNVIFELGKMKLETQCAMLCLRNVACRSYTFYKSEEKCTISDQDHVTNPGKINPKPGAKYFTSQAYKIDQAANPCLQHPCNNYGTCIVKDTENYMCNCPHDYTGVNCETQVIISWSNWSDWSPCNQACGVGAKVRGRSCEDKNSGMTKSKNLCLGPDQEIQSCKIKDCPGWTLWSDWSACSTFTKCGEGVISRSRSCLNEDSDLKCLGPSLQTSPCFSVPCDAPLALKNSLENFGNGPLMIFDDLLNDWAPICTPLISDWSMVNANIVCKQMGFFSGALAYDQISGSEFNKFIMVKFNCLGSESYLTSCPNSGWNISNSCAINNVIGLKCKVDGRWSKWSDWSACSVTCAEGISKRTRACNSPNPSNGGNNCSGDSHQTTSCTKPPCPVNAYWSTWAEWQSCSVSCGGGVQARNRTCVPGKYGGSDCLGVKEESQNCNENPCPVNGYWSDWTTWTTCSISCGGGSQNRSRICTPPQYGGIPCPGYNAQMQECNINPCPVNGVFSLWSTWSSCSASCGGGQSGRTRTCTPPLYGGTPCVGEGSQEQACNTNKCPIDGVWLQWSDWSNCNVSCGGGTRLRVRNCQVPMYGGKDCVGPSFAYENCNDNPCKIDGQWSLWSRWFDCSVTCGSGVQTRMRICSEAQFGGNTCEGNSEESKSCNSGECPSPGIWSEWGSYSTCSATCGSSGIRTRTRGCNMTPSGANSLPCQPTNGNLDTKSCNNIACAPIASTCSELFTRGLEEDSYVNLAINLFNIMTSIPVKCVKEDKSAIIVSSFSTEQQLQSTDFQSPKVLKYSSNGTDLSLDQVKAFVDGYPSCKQFVSWKCSLAPMNSRAGTKLVYWKNRNSENMAYWGSTQAAAGAGIQCQCSLASCDGYGCNCDKVSADWQEDNGYLTKKLDIPVKELITLDNGQTKTQSKFTIGNLICNNA